MIKVEALLLNVDYRESFWELPVRVSPGWHRGLIGWITGEPRLEAGVPEDVARLIAAVLVRHAVVTFFRGTGRSPFLRHLLGLRTRIGRHFVAIHATRAEEAIELFDAAYFNWAMRLQVVLLSALGMPPPVFTEEHLDLTQNGENFGELASLGFTGLLLPGVDGDVAGLFTPDEDLWNGILGDLRSSGEASGIAWREVTESQFGDLLAAGPSGTTR